MPTASASKVAIAERSIHTFHAPLAQPSQQPKKLQFLPESKCGRVTLGSIARPRRIIALLDRLLTNKYANCGHDASPVTLPYPQVLRLPRGMSMLLMGLVVYEGILAEAPEALLVLFIIEDPGEEEDDEVVRRGLLYADLSHRRGAQSEVLDKLEVARETKMIGGLEEVECAYWRDLLEFMVHQGQIKTDWNWMGRIGKLMGRVQKHRKLKDLLKEKEMKMKTEKDEAQYEEWQIAADKIGEALEMDEQEPKVILVPDSESSSCTLSGSICEDDSEADIASDSESGTESGTDTGTDTGTRETNSPPVLVYAPVFKSEDSISQRPTSRMAHSRYPPPSNESGGKSSAGRKGLLGGCGKTIEIRHNVCSSDATDSPQNIRAEYMVDPLDIPASDDSCRPLLSKSERKPVLESSHGSASMTLSDDCWSQTPDSRGTGSNYRALLKGQSPRSEMLSFHERNLLVQERSASHSPSPIPKRLREFGPKSSSPYTPRDTSNALGQAGKRKASCAVETPTRQNARFKASDQAGHIVCSESMASGCIDRADVSPVCVEMMEGSECVVSLTGPWALPETPPKAQLLVLPVRTKRP